MKKREINTLFNMLLIDNKRAIMNLEREYSEEGKFKEETIQKADITGKEFALVFYDFKCSNRKCNKETELQYHHIVTRNYKRYLPFNVYLTQRRYWANIIVLCPDCHLEIHKFDEDTPKPVECISKKLLKRLKKKWQKK